MHRGYQSLRRHIACDRRRFLSGSLAVGVTLPLLGRGGLAQEQQVNVYNWDTYIGETTLEDFADATGIAVRYDLFGSNEELFAKLREGNPGYDVIVPGNDFVERMLAADMLMPLDHALIPNFANLDPVFATSPYDPQRTYSAPYFWGTIGIGYRMSKASPTSLADLFESDAYAGRMAWLNSRDTIQLALKYLGYSINTENPDEIAAATELLIAAKPNVRAMAPDTGQDLLIAGDVDVTIEYSGDIAQVMEEDDDLTYVVPAEGAIVWEDDMCIPKGAPHYENANRFINFILDGKVHGAIATEIKYASPNAAAMDYIPEEDKANPAIYPPRNLVEQSEIAIYKGEEQQRLFSEALTRVLAA